MGIAHAFVLTPPRITPKRNDDEEQFVSTLDTTFDSSEAELQTRLLAADSKIKEVYYQLPNFEIIIPHLLAGKLNDV